MKKRTKNKQSKSRRKFLTPEERELRELKIIEENIQKAIKMRDILVAMMEEKPDAEGFLHIEKLGASIAAETRKLHSKYAEKFRRDFILMARDLHATADEADGEELLRLGKDAQAEKNLQTLLKLRDDMNESILKKMPPEEKPEEIIAGFDRVAAEVREKLDRKRAEAEQRRHQKAEEERRYEETQKLYKQVFPGHTDMRKELLESFKPERQTPLTADGTEYEMPDDYKEAVEQRENVIKLRDLFLPILERTKAEKPDEDHSEIEQHVKELSDWIDESEKALKAEKETFQVARRSRAEAEVYVDDYENALQDAIAENPHLLLGGKTKLKGQ